MYLANNHCNSQRTKHIDTRRYFFCEWVEDVMLKTIFTPTLENTEDIFTNNTSEAIFQTHSVKLVKTIPKGTEMCNVITLHFQSNTLFLNLNRMNGLKSCAGTK
jgi:hypothetical protein